MRRHTLEFRSTHEDDTLALGAALGRLFHAGSGVLIFGGLGAGKTCLVRGIAQGLGLDPALVHSPTFALLHRYEPTLTHPPTASPAPATSGAPATAPRPTAAVPLIHIDAYRLGHDHDPASLGLDAALPGQAASAIEWPQRLPLEPDGRLPRDLAPIAWAGVWIAPEPLDDTAHDAAPSAPHDPPSWPRLLTLRVPAAWLDDPDNPHAAALRRACGGVIAHAPTAPDEPQDWLALARATPPDQPLIPGPRHAPDAATPDHTPCPITGLPVPRSSPSWPFADERARMADLHRWLSERYRLPD